VGLDGCGRGVSSWILRRVGTDVSVVVILRLELKG
jgi:hypothetical protein